MKQSIFVNMLVNDLNRSMEFFKKLGYSFNEQFTDETAASLVISDTIYAMLLTEKKMKTFTKEKQLIDPRKSTEVLLALNQESRAAVDAMMEKVISAGGNEFRDPEDYGFMYSRSFEDLDGHIWELFYMDESQLKS